MNSNVNVYAIQYYPEELENVLNNIKGGLNIVYSNMKSSINLNGMKLKTRKFDTMLYNEESGVMILLMRGGLLNKDNIIKYLEDNDKQYVEVSFENKKYEYQDGDNIPELCFVRDRNDLNNTLGDSICKGIYECIFYPSIEGHLDLGYFSRDKLRFSVDGRKIKGVIKLEDKLVFVVNQINNVYKNGKSRNMYFNDIIKIIKSFGIKCNVNYDKYPNLYEENFSEKVKTLSKSLY